MDNTARKKAAGADISEKIKKGEFDAYREAIRLKRERKCARKQRAANKLK